MKKLHKTFICLLLSVSLMPSCTKTLELNPISQISNATFWKTENDANGGLYGMYASLRPQAGSNLFLWGEARSEVLGPGISGVVNYGKYFYNTLNKTDSGPDWLGLYSVVHDANLILKYVPGISFTSEGNKNNILAQAHTMRAFVYFLMARTWGDLPLVTQPTEGYTADSIQKERTPVAQIFEFIKKDIDDALQLFPDNNYNDGRNVWSKPAANALKADVFLWTGKKLGGGDADFNTALSALAEVQTSDIQLLQNFDDIFRYENKGNKEIIMAVRFQEIEAPETVYYDFYMTPFYMPANVDSATKEAIGIPGGINYAAPSSTIRSQFTTDDQRKNASFTDIYTIEPDGTKKYYSSVVSKFRGLVSGGTRKFLDDIVLYRYADVLLMKAEAENALGQDPSPEINEVRQRAYGNNFNAHMFVNGTKEENDETILKERMFELVFEGKRWWDLIRFGKVFEKVPSLLGKENEPYLLLFPISEVTLSLEPKVVQNPGY